MNWVKRLVGEKDFDCNDMIENCSDYIDEAMSASVAKKFRSHMDSCTDCNTLVATFRATVMTLRDLPRRTPASDLQARIRSRIAQEPSDASGPTPLI
jgi:anti-sigma factor RsiW